MTGDGQSKGKRMIAEINKSVVWLVWGNTNTPGQLSEREGFMNLMLHSGGKSAAEEGI